MKSTKKFAIVILSILLAVASLCGCTASPASPTNPSEYRTSSVMSDGRAEIYYDGNDFILFKEGNSEEDLEYWEVDSNGTFHRFIYALNCGGPVNGQWFEFTYIPSEYSKIETMTLKMANMTLSNGTLYYHTTDGDTWTIWQS